MDNLKESFEKVADWCEKHLEQQRGQEIGMTFGAMLKAYGRLARLPYRLKGQMRADAQRELNAKAEELLLKLSCRIVVACGGGEPVKPVEPTSIRTNMTYDPGPPPKE
jgi:hypothetical protein